VMVSTENHILIGEVVLLGDLGKKPTTEARRHGEDPNQSAKTLPLINTDDTDKKRMSAKTYTLRYFHLRHVETIWSSNDGTSPGRMSGP
jgi:hypothetical protein